MTEIGDELAAKMLPNPTLTFTLPSLQDDIAIDSRIYHPHSLSPSPSSPPWRKHVAIVAHPYAPLGGCYDDPIVDVVAATLLRAGFLVGTFNFRGAAGSAGRTTWTARAERCDYMTLVGFMAYYAHYLDPFGPSASPAAKSHDSDQGSPAQNEAASILTSPHAAQSSEGPVMLLAGYSYGAMITAQLPSLGTIMASFDTPTCGSAAAETRMRAQHLAETQNTVLHSARAAAMAHSQTSRSPRKSLGLRVGGDEENRKSHDGRRSFSRDPEDRIRKGVAELMSKARKGQRRHGEGGGVHGHTSSASDGGIVSAATAADTAGAGSAEEHLLPVPDLEHFRVAYLLVSPLQGLVTNLATMSFPVPFWGKHRRSLTHGPAEMSKNHGVHGAHGTQGANMSHKNDGGHGGHNGHGGHSDPLLVEAEEKLIKNPTLAIYGDQDVFVAAKKLREWASRLTNTPQSRFRAHEVSTAGHFWTEDRVVYIMRDAVKLFAESTLLDTATAPH